MKNLLVLLVVFIIAFQSATVFALNSSKITNIFEKQIKLIEDRKITSKRKILLLENIVKKLERTIKNEKNNEKVDLYNWFIKILKEKIQILKSSDTAVSSHDQTKDLKVNKSTWWENRRESNIESSESTINIEEIKNKYQNMISPKKEEFWYCYLTYYQTVDWKTQKNHDKLSTKKFDKYSINDLNSCADLCREVAVKWTNWFSCSLESEKFFLPIQMSFAKLVNEGVSVNPIKNIKNPEMYVIGVYEGMWGSWQWALWNPGKVKVTVSKNLWVLVLSSYESVEWDITLTPGIVVEHIITNWYYNQKVIWNGNIPVTQISVENGNVYNGSSDDPKTDYLWTFYQVWQVCTEYTETIYEEPKLNNLWQIDTNTERKIIGTRPAKSCQKDYYPNANKILKRLTGLVVTWFNGTYTGESFEIK